MSIQSALSAIHRKSKSVVHLAHGRGAVSEIIHTAELAAASEAFGYLYAKHPDKMEYAGVPVTAIVGVLAKAAATYASVRTRGHSEAAGHLNALANAGLGAFFFADGVRRGHEAAAKEHPAAKKLPGTDVLGEIPQAKGGAWLTDEELAGFRRR